MSGFIINSMLILFLWFGIILVILYINYFNLNAVWRNAILQDSDALQVIVPQECLYRSFEHCLLALLESNITSIFWPCWLAVESFIQFCML